MQDIEELMTLGLTRGLERENIAVVPEFRHTGHFLEQGEERPPKNFPYQSAGETGNY